MTDSARPVTVVERLRERHGDAGAIAATTLLQSTGATRLDLLERAEDEPLGRYSVTGLLGEGGMARVLQVSDAELGRVLAAKVVSEQTDPWMVAKFVREAQVMGQLEHPNIVPVHELGLAPDGRLYFTMKRVEGMDLDSLLELVAAAVTSQEHPPEGTSLVELLRIFLKICDGVGYAHSRGVIHRDLKPANIMVGRFGEVLVMDWGLARPGWVEDATWTGGEEAPGLALSTTGPLAERLEALAPVDESALLTQDGEVVGTPTYMPPEQAAGRTDRIDPRSDIYALGAILYELLTLTPPYTERDSKTVLARVVAGELESPTVRAPERRIPWELEAVVLKAMAYRRGQRYVTVEALAADVTRYLEGRTLAAARYRPWQRVYKWFRRHRLAALASLLGLLVLLGLAGWGVSRWARRQAVRALDDRAHAEFGAGRYTYALVDCERALALRRDPRLERLAADCRLQLARAREEDRRTIDEAARQRQLSETLRPIAAKLDEARTYLYARDVDIRAKLEEVAAVVRVLEQLAAQPASARHVELWWLLGRGHEITGDGAAALRYLRDAARLAPTDDRIQRALGRLYLERSLTLLVRPDGGQRARAAAVRERALAHLSRVRPGAGGELDRQLLPVYAAFARGQAEVTRRLCLEGLARFGRQLGAEQFLAMLGWVSPPAEQLAAWGQALERRPQYAWLYFARGNVRHKQGDRTGALADLDAALKIHPRMAIAHADRGAVLHALGRHGEALTAYDQALTLDPDNPAAHTNRGLALAQLGRSADAVAAHDRAITLNPQFGVAYLNRGKLRHDLGQWAQALPDLERAVALGPTARALHLRGITRFKTGDALAARADLGRALELDPEDPLIWCDRGDLRREAGDLQGALSDLDKALALAPRSALALTLRARTWLAGGQPAKALADLDGALAATPGDPRVHLLRGEACLDLRRPADAEAAYTSALTLDATQFGAWTGRAGVRRERGDLTGAAADVARALALNARHAPAHLERGLLAQAAGDAAAALRSFDHALRLDPTLIEGYRRRGMLYQAARQLDRAIADYDRVLQHPPPDPTALRNRAECHYHRKDWARSEADWTRLLALRPDLLAAYLARGVCRRNLKRPVEARADFRAAVQLQPQSWQGWASLGGAEAELGNTAAARAAYTRGIALAPERYKDRLRKQLAAVPGSR